MAFVEHAAAGNGYDLEDPRWAAQHLARAPADRARWRHAIAPLDFDRESFQEVLNSIRATGDILSVIDSGPVPRRG